MKNQTWPMEKCKTNQPTQPNRSSNVQRPEVLGRVGVDVREQFRRDPSGLLASDFDVQVHARILLVRRIVGTDLGQRRIYPPTGKGSYRRRTSTRKTKNSNTVLQQHCTQQGSKMVNSSEAGGG
jgi:hypothetical protein